MPSRGWLEKYEIVAMDDFPLVRRSQLGGEIAGGAAEHGGQLLRVVRNESTRNHMTSGIGEIDGIPRSELSVHRDDAGRQQ